MEDENPEVRTEAVTLLRALTRAHFGFAVFDFEEKQQAAIKRWRNALDSGSISTAESLQLGVRRSNLPLGHTLLAHGYRGGVKELDPTGQVVWDFSIKGAWAAERLRNGNTLVASYSERRIMEVDTEGEEVWSFKTPNLNARELWNGNILVAAYSDQRIIEVDRKQNEVVWEFAAQNSVHDAVAVGKDRILFVWKQGVREIKRSGEIVWEWIGTEDQSKLYGVQRLDNGNTLIADYGLGRVVEVARNKEVVWEIAVSRPSDAFRLPNGNTLITTSREHIEVTPQKEKVWIWPGARSGSARR